MDRELIAAMLAAGLFLLFLSVGFGWLALRSYRHRTKAIKLSLESLRENMRLNAGWRAALGRGEKLSESAIQYARAIEGRTVAAIDACLDTEKL